MSGAALKGGVSDAVRALNRSGERVQKNPNNARLVQAVWNAWPRIKSYFANVSPALIFDELNESVKSILGLEFVGNRLTTSRDRQRFSDTASTPATKKPRGTKRGRGAATSELRYAS